MLDSPEKLLLGLFTGFCFGFLLHRGRVARFDVIVGQFLLRDFTMLRMMLTAIVVGGVGVAILVSQGLATYHIKPMLTAAVAVGAAIFGVGLAILGYCPGTVLAAMASGSRHAIAGALGMLTGAALYAELYPVFVDGILKAGDRGALTLPQVLGAAPLTLLFGLAVVALAIFYVLQRFEAVRRATFSN